MEDNKEKIENKKAVDIEENLQLKSLEKLENEQAENIENSAKKKEISLEQKKGKTFGKFNDGQALLKAYENLEAEFTKKCQKLSELEEKFKGISVKENGEPPPMPPINFSDEEYIEKEILTNKEIVNRVISDYLQELLKGNAPQTISGDYGLTPLTPPIRPKTISEAGRMAERLLR